MPKLENFYRMSKVPISKLKTCPFSNFSKKLVTKTFQLRFSTFFSNAILVTYFSFSKSDILRSIIFRSITLWFCTFVNCCVVTEKNIFFRKASNVTLDVMFCTIVDVVYRFSLHFFFRYFW